MSAPMAGTSSRRAPARPTASTARWAIPSFQGRSRFGWRRNSSVPATSLGNHPLYVVMAVTVDGTRDILGIWAGDGGEGAK